MPEWIVSMYVRWACQHIHCYLHYSKNAVVYVKLASHADNDFVRCCSSILYNKNMKLFGEYIRRLFISFAALITGGVIGLYYVFVYPYIEAWEYRSILDIAIPIAAFMIAGFLAWRNLYQDNRVLKQQIADLKNELPDYKLKVIDETHQLDKVLKEIDEDIKHAESEKSKAPSPNSHSWLPVMASITRTLSKDDWEKYKVELGKYRSYIEEIAAIDGYRMINFELTNKGKADKNLNVTLYFENCEQIPEFFDEQIESKKPSEPSSNYIGSLVSNIGPIDRLGSRREIHEEKKNLLSVEYDVMRGGDVFHLHYNPIFVKSINDNPMQVKYCFKSDKLVQTAEKTLTLK